MNLSSREHTMLDSVDVLITDLDETLFYPGREELPAGLQSEMYRWRNAGGHWGIATGRSISMLRGFFQEWGFYPDFYVARERYIVRCVRHREAPFRCWNRRIQRKAKRVERDPSVWMPSLKQWVERRNYPAVHNDYYSEFKHVPHASEAERYLMDILSGDRKPIRNKHLLGVVHADIGKGRCIQRMARSAGWRADQILCVGDSANDRDMLDGRYGYRSAAVQNAEDEIKSLVRENGGFIVPHESGTAILHLLRALIDSAV